MVPDTVEDVMHCTPHIATVLNGSARYVDMSVLQRVEYDSMPHCTWKEKNTVYTLKLWDGEQTISKFAIWNRNWRSTDLVYLFGWVPEVLQNSLPLSGGKVYFYDITPEVDIVFYQLYWLRAYSKAWEMHQRIWKLAGIKLMISIWDSISN